MSIEVRIPKEITEYKEKIIFGLSIRKLLCVMVVAVVGGLAFYIGWIFFGEDTATYISAIVSIPIFAFGFIKPNGFAFEKYASMMFNHQFGYKRRRYSSVVEIVEKIEKKVKPTSWKNESKRGDKNAISKQKKESKNLRECTIFEVTEKDRKRKSKEAIREIKAAKQEYRREKQSAKKAVKKGSSTTDSAADNQI